MNVMIREMTVQDYDEVLSLWRISEGVGLSDSDSEEGVACFLNRNPDLSFVARDGGHLVGAVLCGQDGRRGYIHHLAVSQSHRRQGLGRTLVQQCLSTLRRAGIDKCHIFVFAANQDSIAFWKSIGWTQRVELIQLSQYT